MEDRRSEFRVLCADMVDVHWLERNRKRRATGLLEDISASGACLQMELPVPAGAEICWEAAGVEFRGLVRYCAYREIGYFVGVQFDRESKWSEATYQPEHLLDPRLIGLKVQ